MPKLKRDKSRESRIRRLRRWYRYRRPRTKFFLVCSALFLIAVVITVLLAWSYRITQRGKPVRYGVSFSQKYAEELGVDWKANYTALLDDLGFKRLRLMSYWDLHEPQRDTYDFSALDWQMDEAAKHGAKVMLAVGLRQPRWPECHIPPWAERLQLDVRNKELYDYIAAVAQRYSNNPALESYQLENEYFNRNFGSCDDYSRERLKHETDLLHTVDPAHPVVISFANQLGMPVRGPHPDIYATSLYRGNYIRYIGYFAYPISSHFYGAKALLIRWLFGQEVLIHELQLEPWGPRTTSVLSDEEQEHYMSPSRMQSNLAFARRTGMRTIYTWGSEWWYWRKTQRSDSRQWDIVKAELQKFPDTTSPLE